MRVDKKKSRTNSKRSGGESVLIRDSDVRKSTFSRSSPRRSSASSPSTDSIEFATRSVYVDDKVVNTQIWDTTGQERCGISIHPVLETAQHLGEKMVRTTNRSCWRERGGDDCYGWN